MSADSESYPKAVCLYFQREDSKILAVSRKNDPTKWGLPGGKVDAGETELEALTREVREEVGLAVPTTVAKIYSQVCMGEQNYWTTTYYSAELRGTPKTSEPIEIAWVDRQTLLDGPFGKYLANLFTFLDQVDKIKASIRDHAK
jgi:8-oxo-dGTP diphosphatase